VLKHEQWILFFLSYRLRCASAGMQVFLMGE